MLVTLYSVLGFLLSKYLRKCLVIVHCAVPENIHNPPTEGCLILYPHPLEFP